MYSSLRYEYGEPAIPRTRMCGVTGQRLPSYATKLEVKIPSREVKFGALMKHLGNDGEWLATGMAPRTTSPLTPQGVILIAT